MFLQNKGWVTGSHFRPVSILLEKESWWVLLVTQWKNIHVHIYVNMHVYVCVYICMAYVYMCVCIHTCVYVCVCVYVWKCVCVCVYTHTHVCITGKAQSGNIFLSEEEVVRDYGWSGSGEGPKNGGGKWLKGKNVRSDSAPGSWGPTILRYKGR